MGSFVHLITSFGILAILLVVFAESGLLIGFIFPGDSLLFTAGYMVQQNILHIDIHIFAIPSSSAGRQRWLQFWT